MSGKSVSGSNMPASVSDVERKDEKHHHPADVAGMTRHAYFQTDLWIIGEKQYKTPKNTVPTVLESAFAHSKSGPSPQINMTYNRDKFAIDRLTGLEEGREFIAWVHSKELGEGVVDITMRADTFVVQLFKGAQGQKFPFTKEEFLSALLAGKINVELDQLENQSDSESDEEHK